MQNKTLPALPPSVGSTLPLGLIPPCAGQGELGVQSDEEEEKENGRPPKQCLVLTRCLPRRVEDKGRGEGVPSRVGADSRCRGRGGHRVGLQGQLCPRAAACCCRPRGTVPPARSAPAAALSSLLPKSDRTQTKGLQISCRWDFHLTIFFPRVFQETFEAAGHAAVSGGAAVLGCTACVGGRAAMSECAAISGVCSHVRVVQPCHPGAGSPSASPGSAAIQLCWHRNYHGSATASLRCTIQLNTE